MESMTWILLAEMLLTSILSFCLMGMDKHRARRKAWRIPEKILFFPVIFGGGVGGTLGMFLFHHKTRHWYFRFGFPFFAAVQIILLFVLLV